MPRTSPPPRPQYCSTSTTLTSSSPRHPKTPSTPAAAELTWAPYPRRGTHPCHQHQHRD
ncbi:hypothetical protein BD779DRAFT_1563688, partial [Infundibulicybe gibba]